MPSVERKTAELFDGADKLVAVANVHGRMAVCCHKSPRGLYPFEKRILGVRVWDLESRKALGPWIDDPDPDDPKAAALGLVGEQLTLACGGSGGEIRFWRVPTGELIGTIDTGES